MELLTKTIGFPESLDEASIAEFHQQVKGAIASEAMVILVNFENVEFMSSPGLMTLVVAFKRAREASKKMLLCSINEQVRMLLELAGMDQVFEIIDSHVQAEACVELSLIA